MIPELRSAIQALGNLKGLNDSQLENVAAILLLNHYKHAIPYFEEKDWYISEIERDGKLRQDFFARRKQTNKNKINAFMAKHAIVK